MGCLVGAVGRDGDDLILSRVDFVRGIRADTDLCRRDLVVVEAMVVLISSLGFRSLGRRLIPLEWSRFFQLLLLSCDLPVVMSLLVGCKGCLS